jgi:acetylxylan esterase
VSLQPVEFGPGSPDLALHALVPAGLDRSARPPVIVAVHNCTQSGPLFHAGPAAEFAARAEDHGYLMLFPSALRAGGCFDVSSPRALRRGGGGDPDAIAAMVAWARRTHGAGPAFAIGLSSGAMMTNVLLATHPDVFTAGAAFAGVPFGGFADGPDNWNEDCARGRLTRTGREWGDLARAAAPGYTGPRPRVQLWHSTGDDILDHRNLGEAVKQWTDVHAVAARPALDDRPRPAGKSWHRRRYGDPSATAPVEAISVQQAEHNVLDAGMAAFTLDFFGLGPRPPAGR